MPPLYLHMNDVSYEPVGDATPPVDPPTGRITGWRFLHRAEGGRYVPDGMPEIRNATNDVVTEMTKAVQELAWDVMIALNPDLAIRQYQKLHWWDRAMNNGMTHGYNSDGEQHTDWVTTPLQNNTGLTNPNYDKTRGYGGQLIQGYDEGDYIRCVPGVHMIDPRNLPTLEKVLENRWYSLAVNAFENGTVGNWEQGNINESYGVIGFLWISDRDVIFPKSWFQKWDEDFYPDHLTMYIHPSLVTQAVLFVRRVLGV